jgi:hypothetical protein
MKTLCFFLISILASPAAAEKVTMVSPVFSQIVVTPLPTGFQPFNEKTEAGRYILEAMHQTETLENWTQMLTLTSAQGMGGTQGAAVRMANTLAENYRAVCPDHLIAEPIQAPAIPGAVEVFAAFLGCTTIPGSQPEAMVVLAMAGRSDLYTLQWAVRADASDAPLTYDLAEWTPRLAHLAAGTRLCAIVPGEAPPYPSCTGK